MRTNTFASIVMLCLVLVGICLLAPYQPVSAQQLQQVGPLDGGKVAAAATFGTALDSTMPLPDQVVLTAVVTGAPTTCTFGLYGTLKPLSDPSLVDNDYEALGTAVACDATAAANGTVSQFIVQRPMRTIRPKVVTLAGGTSPAVNFKVFYRGAR